MYHNSQLPDLLHELRNKNINQVPYISRDPYKIRFRTRGQELAYTPIAQISTPAVRDGFESDPALQQFH